MSAPGAAEVARVAARSAASVAGVIRVDAGPFGTKSTYGGGERVEGVTVRTGRAMDSGPQTTAVTVHVVVGFGQPIPELAQAVARAVGDALGAASPSGGPWDIGVDVVDIAASEAVADLARGGAEPRGRLAGDHEAP